MENLHAWFSVYPLPKARATRTEAPHPSSGDLTHCFQSLSSSNLKLDGIIEAQGRGYEEDEPNAAEYFVS